jgi:two-component system response regulator FlrC
VVQRALILQSHGQITVDELIFEEDIAHMPTLEEQLPFLTESFAVPMESMNPVAQADTIAAERLGDGVRSAEEKIILQMLREARGSRKTTAEKLGISPRTLRYKLARMKESGVAVPC